MTDFVIPAGASDPYVNTASVTCSPAGFPNIYNDTASWSTNLFQPRLAVDKTGPEFTKEGDTASYEVTIKNNSSTDAPDLVIDTITDTLVGNLKDAGNTAVTGNTCAPAYQLASDASCKITYDYLVADGSGQKLSNTVKVETHPAGFPNDVDAQDTYEATLLHPAYTVTKDCKAGTEPVPQEGPALFTIVITNTGDADLVITADDGIGDDQPGGRREPVVPDQRQGAVHRSGHRREHGAHDCGSRHEVRPPEHVREGRKGRLPCRRSRERRQDDAGRQRSGRRLDVKLYSGPDGFDTGTLLATATRLPTRSTSGT